MPQFYFTADTHFGHSNILSHDGRPFMSIYEHDIAIIAGINDTLKEGDILFHLGDIAWTKPALARFSAMVRNDIHIRLIRGNHDSRNIGLEGCERIEEICDVKLLEIPASPVWLSHYGHRSWPGRGHGSFHFYGHSHGNLPAIGRSTDVGVMVRDYKPVSLDELLTELSDIHPFDDTPRPFK